MSESVRRPARRAVHVVDDDAQVRRAIWYMLESAGYAPRVFACGDDLLDEFDHFPSRRCSPICTCRGSTASSCWPGSGSARRRFR